MSEVDDRIVSIQFDNASFERRLEQTLQSLEKLSESLRFANANKGIQQVSNAVNGFDPSHMTSAVDSIAHRFSTLGIVGAAAIANLTFSALNFVKKIGGDILDPIIGGGTSRAKNLEQAQFLFEGIGIDVEKGMDSALKAVKGTAFGLDEAAKSAAQFGASGIKVGEQMTGALRGVAGVAALTGRSFSEIGDIFASSAATGVVNNQDLMQFATRGINVSAELAKQMGITEADVHNLAAEGKISFKEFADAMDKAFGKHATEANKTYTGSLANLHAAFSRLGAAIITPHLHQQRDLFNALSPVIDNIHDALMPVINDFILFKGIINNNLISKLNHLDTKSFGKGIQNLGVAFINLYQAFKPVVTVFRRAFAEIFSGSAGKSFISLTESFKNFTGTIKIGADTLQKIKSIFRGFFAALEIGFEIFRGITHTIAAVIEALLPAGQGILHFGASTGDFLVNLNKALVAGGGIQRFFSNLSAILVNPVKSFQRLKDAVIDFFNGINFRSHGPLKFLQDLRDKLFDFFNIHVGNTAEKGLVRVRQRIEQVHDVWDKVQNAFTKTHDFLRPVLTYMSNWFKSLGHKLAAAFKPGDFNSVLDIINVGLIGGIALLIKKFTQGGFSSLLGTDFLSRITGVFDQLTNTLKTMQAKVKTDILIKIAEAVAILVAALLVLSLIDSKALTKALGALTISFGELIGVMVALDKVNLSTSIVKLNGIATAMILISSAMVILSAAIKVLSTMKLGDLAKGLGGVAVGLGLLVAATRLISADTSGLISAGLAMIVISAGLLVLSRAVKAFAKMPMGDLAKGLGAVTLSLVILVKALNSITSDTSGLIKASVTIIAISTALIILNKAVRLFAAMSFAQMAKGFIGIAAGLTALIVAMNFISTNPAGLISASIAMIAISVAMNIMARALAKMGGMDLGVLAKGIGALAAVLLILVVATNSMSEAAGGAVAIFIVAEALKVMVKVLQGLAQIKTGDLIKGLLAIAGLFLVLGLSAAVLSTLIPEMIGLGIALGLLGASFALFGVGASLIAKSFEIMAKSGAAGAKGIVEALSIIITALPRIEKALFDFAVSFVKDILKAAPLLLRLFTALMEQLLETVIDLAPRIAKAAVVVIESFLFAVRAVFPDLVKTGFEMLVAFLSGLSDNIDEITNLGVDIVLKFIAAIIERMPDLVNAAVDLITSFLAELGKHAGELVTAGVNLIVNLLNGITNNVGRIISAIANLIVTIITELGKHANEIVSAGAKVLTDFLKGIGDNLDNIVDTVGDVIARFILELANNASKIIDAGTDALIHFLHGLTRNVPRVLKALTEAVFSIMTSIATEIPKQVEIIVKAGLDMLIALFNGMADALDSRASELGTAMGRFGGSLANAFATIVSSAIKEGLKKAAEGAAGDFFGFAVPGAGGLGGLLGGGETVIPNPTPEQKRQAKNSGFSAGAAIGNAVVTGYTSGISSTSITSVTGKFAESLAVIPDTLAGLDEFNPTITPVLDLTKVVASSKDISGILSAPILTSEVSLSQAKTISTTTEQLGTDTTTTEPVVTNVTFEQTINAPTELSVNDIYKNTKSQIALAKEKLGVG